MLLGSSAGAAAGAGRGYRGVPSRVSIATAHLELPCVAFLSHSLVQRGCKSSVIWTEANPSLAPCRKTGAFSAPGGSLQSREGFVPSSLAPAAGAMTLFEFPAPKLPPPGAAAVCAVPLVTPRRREPKPGRVCSTRRDQRGRSATARDRPGDPTPPAPPELPGRGRARNGLAGFLPWGRGARSGCSRSAARMCFRSCVYCAGF